MPKFPEKPASKAVAKPRAKRPPKPFLRFYHSETLRAKTLVVLTAVEEAKDPRQHRGALADIVVELTDSGMDYFYLRPLKLAKAGFFTEQSANVGLATTTRVMASVIRHIIGGMDNPQLLSVCGYIRQLME
jgi:hypothetical protein